MFAFRKVTKEFTNGIFRKKTVRAVDNISVEFPSNRIVGLLGENGAGKTTMIKLISGLLFPTSGQVLIDGMNWKENKAELYQSIGTMLEGGRTTHWPLSVRQNLEYFGVLRGVTGSVLKNKIESSIDFFGLRDKADTPVTALSKGMKQKLSLAISMIHDPRKLILDEPVSGIDYSTSLMIQKRLKEWVKEKGRTVLITTHDMHVAGNVCDWIIIIRKGRVIADDELHNLVNFFSGRKYCVRFQNSCLVEDKIHLDSETIDADWDDNSKTLSFVLNDHISIDHVIFHLSEKYGKIDSIQSERMRLGDIYSKLVYDR